MGEYRDGYWTDWLADSLPDGARGLWWIRFWSQGALIEYQEDVGEHVSVRLRGEFELVLRVDLMRTLRYSRGRAGTLDLRPYDNLLIMEHSLGDEGKRDTSLARRARKVSR